MATSSAKPSAVPLWVDILLFHLEQFSETKLFSTAFAFYVWIIFFYKILSDTLLGKNIPRIFDLKAVRETKNVQIPKKKKKRKTNLLTARSCENTLCCVARINRELKQRRRRRQRERQ